MKMSSKDDVLYSTEAESVIEGLQPFGVIAIGSPRWQQQHDYIEKLNIQAMISASEKREEFVKEQIVSLDKVSTLITELITVEVWKEKVFPHFVSLKLEPDVMFPLYMVLYHEATAANLLELTMFHQDTCEAAGDQMLDMVDYCYHKILHLTTCNDKSNKRKTSTKDADSIATIDELNDMKVKLDFDLGMKCLSIFRYITDHAGQLSVSILNRMLNIHDVPLLLAGIIEIAPWRKEHEGVFESYIDNSWVTIDAADRFKLSKLEAQVWLSLYNMLLSDAGRQQYEFNHHRKSVLLRLRSYLTEILRDQLPVMGDFQRYLEQLAIMDPPTAQNSLILEQLPEIKEKILMDHEGRWEEIAKKQHEMYYKAGNVNLKLQAQRLAATYNFDMLDACLNEVPKCVLCGSEATKRCSRCQNEWYCRRECQVNHWKKHKPACDLMATALDTDKDSESASK